MIDLSKDILSLTDFKRKTSECVKQMKASGNPLVLTVNGRAELVVQDAESYQKMLELIDRTDAIEGIKRGLKSMRRGEGRSAEEGFAEIRRKHGIPG